MIRLDDSRVLLVDAEGERIGELADLIIHHGEDRITHAAIRAGSLLRREYILVPFEHLVWDTEEERFVANFDRLDDYPRYRQLEDIPDPVE
jgi:sporulation protein YlmC with PRC-barrel domain